MKDKKSARELVRVDPILGNIYDLTQLQQIRDVEEVRLKTYSEEDFQYFPDGDYRNSPMYLKLGSALVTFGYGGKCSCFIALDILDKRTHTRRNSWSFNLGRIRDHITGCVSDLRPEMLLPITLPSEQMTFIGHASIEKEAWARFAIVHQLFRELVQGNLDVEAKLCEAMEDAVNVRRLRDAALLEDITTNPFPLPKAFMLEMQESAPTQQAAQASSGPAASSSTEAKSTFDPANVCTAARSTPDAANVCASASTHTTKQFVIREDALRLTSDKKALLFDAEFDAAEEAMIRELQKEGYTAKDIYTVYNDTPKENFREIFLELKKLKANRKTYNQASNLWEILCHSEIELVDAVKYYLAIVKQCDSPYILAKILEHPSFNDDAAKKLFLDAIKDKTFLLKSKYRQMHERIFVLMASSEDEALIDQLFSHPLYKDALTPRQGATMEPSFVGYFGHVFSFAMLQAVRWKIGASEAFTGRPFEESSVFRTHPIVKKDPSVAVRRLQAPGDVVRQALIRKMQAGYASLSLNRLQEFKRFIESFNKEQAELAAEVNLTLAAISLISMQSKWGEKFRVTPEIIATVNELVASNIISEEEICNFITRQNEDAYEYISAFPTMSLAERALVIRMLQDGYTLSSPEDLAAMYIICATTDNLAVIKAILNICRSEEIQAELLTKLSRFINVPEAFDIKKQLVMNKFATTYKNLFPAVVAEYKAFGLTKTSIILMAKQAEWGSKFTVTAKLIDDINSLIAANKIDEEAFCRFFNRRDNDAYAFIDAFSTMSLDQIAMTIRVLVTQKLNFGEEEAKDAYPMIYDICDATNNPYIVLSFLKACHTEEQRQKILEKLTKFNNLPNIKSTEFNTIGSLGWYMMSESSDINLYVYALEKVTILSGLFDNCSDLAKFAQMLSAYGRVSNFFKEHIKPIMEMNIPVSVMLGRMKELQRSLNTNQELREPSLAAVGMFAQSAPESAASSLPQERPPVSNDAVASNLPANAGN